MGEQARGIRGFGRHLRSIRQARKLSLDAVEELASSYREQVTKSHLSRIENGQAEPSFRRMYTLGRIYGVSVTSLSEQYELDLEREARPAAGTKMTPAEMLAEANQLKQSGDYTSALGLFEMLLEFSPSVCPDRTPEESRAQLALNKSTCLMQLGHYEAAREQAEIVLDLAGLSPQQQRVAYHLLAIAAYHKGRLEIASVLLDRATRIEEGDEAEQPLMANIMMTQGYIESARDRWESATACYERAAALYEEQSLKFERCRARRNLAATYMVRGKPKKSREILGEVIAQAKKEGYEKQLALALGDMAAIAWKDGDDHMVESYCRQSNTIARPREYLSLVFRNCFYLWKVAERAGNRAAMKINLRTLKSYAARVDPSLPELKEFNEGLAGGKPC
jgi:transcriptional regulator with XRE-family HTH domain